MFIKFIFLIIIFCQIPLFCEECFEGKILDVRRYTDEEGVLWEEVETEVFKGKYQGIHISSEPLEGQEKMFPVLSPGDRVILTAVETDDTEEIHVVEPLREKVLLILAAVFSFLLILLGRLKGFAALVSLIFTGILIVFLFIPAVSDGKNPLLSAAIVCVGSTFFTIFSVAGFCRKSLTAIIGTIGGIIGSAAVSLIAGAFLKLTGTADESVYHLIYSLNRNLDFRGILHAGILLGSLGAVMDVAMSLSSAAAELKECDKDISASKLFSSLMNIGKDVTGTMANTLILAYTGGSLTLFLLIGLQPDMSYIKIWNMEFVAAEVLRAAAGSIGILAAVPATSAAAAFLLKKENTGK